MRMERAVFSAPPKGSGGNHQRFPEGGSTDPPVHYTGGCGEINMKNPRRINRLGYFRFLGMLQILVKGALGGLGNVCNAPSLGGGAGVEKRGELPENGTLIRCRVMKKLVGTDPQSFR